jgi:hypothetical protein
MKKPSLPKVRKIRHVIRNPEEYIKRQEDPRQRLAEFAKAIEAAVSMKARVLAHWPTDWPTDFKQTGNPRAQPTP